MKIGWTRAARAGSLCLEPAQPGADHLHVDRADVRAEGVAEIDQPVFAGEIAVADPPAVLVGEGERAAHRRALERRRRRRGRAGAEQQRGQEDEESAGTARKRFRS